VKKTLYALFCSLGLAITPVAKATPALQLDIAGGTYVGGNEETNIASNNLFTLYALGLNSGSTSISTTANYYISAALVKLDGTPVANGTGPNLGSFVFAGSTINAVGDMIFGNPPLEAINVAYDNGDLQKHGIYPTYFKEFSFKFSSAYKTTEYNSQDSPLAHNLVSNVAGGVMYYMPFQVDLSNLTAGYGIHFDLYNETVRNSGDIDTNKFAPFSHDAAGYHHNVPDGGATLALLGLGLLCVGLIARRKV
jgi:VPDSG-CTERM motif